MRLYCVYNTGFAFDDKGWFNLVTHEEFNNGVVKDHGDRLAGHDGRLDKHDGSICDITKRVEGIQEKVKEIPNHANRISLVEQQVKEMPQSMRDALDGILKEILSDPLKVGQNMIADMRREREEIGNQLKDLQRQRDEMRAELVKLREQLQSVERVEREMKDDFSMQVAEFKLSVPVPKKFAKFLFVKPECKPAEKN